MRASFSLSLTIFRNSMSRSWTVMPFQLTILLAKQPFPWSQCFWKEAFLLSSTGSSKRRSIVGRSSLHSPSLQQRKLTIRTTRKRVTAAGIDLPGTCASTTRDCAQGLICYTTLFCIVMS